MKKLLTLLTVAIMAIASSLAMACGQTEVNYTAVVDQITALTEVKNGTSDVAVIDSVMANYYLATNTEFKDLKTLEGETFTYAEEYYAIGFRKIAGDTSTKDWVDYALYLLQEEGVIATIAQTYGLNASLKAIPEMDEPCDPMEIDTNSDFYKSIIADKTFTLGITEFAPMTIPSHNPGTNGYKGFDCELAVFVAQKLTQIFADFLEGGSITYMPQIITWREKENELNAGNIDCIWNGFTVTAEREANICFSAPYMLNRQAIVVRSADAANYVDYASMKSAKFVAEQSSAGEETILEIINAAIFPAE